MLLVLASRHDQAARALVRSWRDVGARLLTCRDLSSAGWRYLTDAPREARAVVGGRVVRAEEIRGVVTRLPAVWPDELPHIVEADRAYVAAEMNAFLGAWLAEAPFPVVNRPTPLCLVGPVWRVEQWLCAAARVGMRLSGATRRLTPRQVAAPEPFAASPTTVTVVGERCFGSADDELMLQARRLARAARVELLAVQFSGPERGAAFAGAHLCPDISRPGVAEALLDCLQTHAAPPRDCDRVSRLTGDAATTRGRA